MSCNCPIYDGERHHTMRCMGLELEDEATKHKESDIGESNERQNKFLMNYGKKIEKGRLWMCPVCMDIVSHASMNKPFCFHNGKARSCQRLRCLKKRTCQQWLRCKKRLLNYVRRLLGF